MCTLWLEWGRLRRWSINAEDRQQRRTPLSLGRVHRLEVHYRVGIGCYEGMAWEEWLSHLVQVKKKTHRVAIRTQQKGFWEVVMQQQRVGRSTVLQQMMRLSTHLFVARKEKNKRRSIQRQLLAEGEGVQRSFLFKMQAVEFGKVHSWGIE